jgi:serine/threonine-protein kinase RsbW
MTTMLLCADLAQLGTIRDFVARASRDLDVDERIIPDLQLAVDEICSNVIRHGYGGRSGRIEITVQAVTNGIQFTVRDWGATFDPEAVPAPDLDAPLEQRSLGGLGLFLVRQLMDKVHFQFSGERGNSVTMVKRLHRKGG